jgi:nitroreductase
VGRRNPKPEISGRLFYLPAGVTLGAYDGFFGPGRGPAENRYHPVQHSGKVTTALQLPERGAMNQVMQVLRSHRSVRKFTDKPVADELIEEIVRCGQAAATSSNLQAATVIRIRSADTRHEIARLAGDQAYVATAGAFLIFCADLNRARRACSMQGGEFVAGMTEHFIIATVDVALFAQNCAVAAESAGLGICYIGGIRNDPERVGTLLDLPDQVYPVFGFCLGYPAQDPEVKPRLPLSVILKEERYRETDDPDGIRLYDEKLRRYYRMRTGGTKDSCWTKEMSALVGRESRPHMRGFLQSRGFSMK